MNRRLTAAFAAALCLFAPVSALAEPDEIGSLIAASTASEAAAEATGASRPSFGDHVREAWRTAQLNITRNWQCVTFARAFSGIQIFGNAWTWWESAAGRYARGSQPETGAVLVFKRQGRMNYGHVAVVSNVLTERVVEITHANWSPIGGRRGQVEENVAMVDVSDANDWSAVKVWYGPSRDLGGSVYPVYGFIYQPGTGPDAVRTASLGGTVHGR